VQATDPTVYVVDDDASVRKGVLLLLESLGYRAVGFDSAKAFLADGGAAGPSCLILDMRMPRVSGLDLQREMASKGIEIPIIFVTGHATVATSVRAMKAGAVDFLEKPFDEQALLDAVTAAIERSRRQGERRLERAELLRRWDSLTERERQVAAMVAKGMYNKEIADELGNRESTVKIHRGRAMRKLAARSVPDLVRILDRLALSGTD
jgi:FixJ family two-component response regulator